MYHFNLLNINHLNNAIFLRKLGIGGFGSIKLYQCKNKCFFKNRGVIEERVEFFEKDEEENNNLCDFRYCNELFVVKKIKIQKKDIHDLYFKDTSDFKYELLYKEYYIGQKLNNEYIIKTYGVDVDKFSLILEYCPGIDLFDYLSKSKYRNNPNMTKFVYIYMQILEAVEYLHDNNIAHMDLKLENIMYNNVTKKIKIIDFGQADYFKTNEKYIYSTTIKGTIEYLPPEVFCPTYYTGDSVDVWSCIIILYNLIYNSNPWESATKKNKYYIICRDYYTKYNTLYKDVFKNPCDYGYNTSDTIIIYKIFECLFKKTRPSIYEIKNLFSKISLFNKIKN